MYNEEKTQVLSTLSKVLDLLLRESDTRKKLCLKAHLAVEIIQEKENAVNVNTV